MTKSMQSIISNPIIVIKTRLEVVGFNEYNGMLDAFQKIYAREGACAFFTGLKVSLIRDVPFAGIFYPLYTTFRNNLFHLYEFEMSANSEASSSDRVKAITVISSTAAMLANICSCTITHPLDLIRTR